MHLHRYCNCFPYSLNFIRIDQQAKFISLLEFTFAIIFFYYNNTNAFIADCWIFCRWWYSDLWEWRSWSFIHNPLQKKNTLSKLESVDCSSFPHLISFKLWLHPHVLTCQKFLYLTASAESNYGENLKVTY